MDLQQLLNERGRTHGDFELQAFYSQSLKLPIQQHRMKAVQERRQPALTHAQYEALDMIMHKSARILAGNPHEVDHWDDIAGYATLIANQIRKAQAYTQANGAKQVEAQEAPEVPAGIFEQPAFMEKESLRSDNGAVK